MLHIHERYQYLAKFVISYLDNPDNPYILKTDCWNEAESIYPIIDIFKGNLFAIEINEDRIAKALEKFPELKIIKGDIRYLPSDFNDKFDLILDFSTIDHVSDYHRVLQNYKKALKFNGILLIVCWHSIIKIEPIDDLWGSFQYYFNYKKFKKELLNLFVLKAEGNLLELNEKSAFLNFYILINSKQINSLKKIEIFIYNSIFKLLGDKNGHLFFKFTKKTFKR